MAREDISMNPALGEMDTTGNIIGKAIDHFSVVDQDDIYVYGEVVVSEHFKKEVIYCYIPYTPIYKPLKLRVKIESLGGAVEFVTNKKTGKMWYEVFVNSEALEPKTIHLSEFRLINESEFFLFTIEDGYISLLSGEDTDMVIKPSLNQNQIFLLKAFAGSIYQHPTTGVGLIDFLHGNFENTGLAERLKKEFEGDKMIINNAYMDSETGELLLEVTEKSE